MMQSGAELELSTALEPANASFCTAGFPRLGKMVSEMTVMRKNLTRKK